MDSAQFSRGGAPKSWMTVDPDTTSQTSIASPIQQSDGSQLSPFAQLPSNLQQLQQTNPTKYQQVTQQIATNLQSTAQAAQSQGNASAANQLSQLATDFTTASTSGQHPTFRISPRQSGATIITPTRMEQIQTPIPAPALAVVQAAQASCCRLSSQTEPRATP